MSSRGRGYAGRGTYGGRGGYRGNSYRGSNPRGSYEGRGRGGYNSHYNSHESRYNSGGGDRYNPGRNDRIDDSYKKPYRSESSNYASRDYMTRGGSPDRKRMRMEGSSDRRSHDGGGHFGSSYVSRQDSYGERRSFGEERRRSPSREGYRKSGGMPPPRSPARMSAPRSRVLRAPRRSFRGRTLRTRPSYRGSVRSRPSYYPRRFSERPHDYTRTFRLTKMRSSVKGVKGDSASSTEGEDWETEEKEEVADEVKEAKIKSPKSETEGAALEEAEEGGDTDKDVPDGASDTDLPRSKYTGRKFIALYCVHCKEKCITFKGYTRHLMLTKHRMSMSAVARRHKAQLLRMRMAQRTAQRDLEATIDSELEQTSAFCLICKLHHRTTRHAHNLTDTHRAMKRFLLPYCRVCDIQFRSPMVYEHHICSLDHIKMKAYQTKRPVSPTKAEEGSGEEGMDVDLDNFMTLDSVGDVDEVDDEDSGTEKKAEDGEKKTATKKPKVDINIGSEHIKKVEVFWCELCKIYLRRVESGSAEEADVLRRHCRLRNHLGRYVRHRDTRTLRKQAERIHRQLQQQKEGVKEENAGEEKEVKSEGESKKKPAENGTEELPASGGGEDKLWADVDKDIGELLREVDPSGTKSSDDEEDLVRYDKFRKSDKKVDGSAVVGAEVVEAEAGGDDDTAPAALAAPV